MLVSIPVVIIRMHVDNVCRLLLVYTEIIVKSFEIVASLKDSNTVIIMIIIRTVIHNNIYYYYYYYIIDMLFF